MDDGRWMGDGGELGRLDDGRWTMDGRTWTVGRLDGWTDGRGGLGRFVVGRGQGRKVTSENDGETLR